MEVWVFIESNGVISDLYIALASLLDRDGASFLTEAGRTHVICEQDTTAASLQVQSASASIGTSGYAEGIGADCAGGERSKVKAIIA